MSLSTGSWTGTSVSPQAKTLAMSPRIGGRFTRRGCSDLGRQLPLLRNAAAAHVLRPRHVAAFERLPRSPPVAGDGAFLPAPCVRMRGMQAGATGPVPDARGNLRRLRVLFLLLRFLA